MLHGKSQSNSKCQIILAAIIFGGMVSFVDFAAFASEPTGKGRVIEFGWDTPTIPWLCDNVAIAECTTPFHGIILDLAQREGQAGLSRHVWVSTAISSDFRQKAEEDIVLLNDANFTRLRDDSFFRINSSGWSSPPDWFDSDFNAVVSNTAFVAAAVNETSLAGIAFDPEDYHFNSWYYPGQKYSATKTFEQYQAQVRQRGREIASAIKSACPGRDFTVLFLFANSLPYISTQWWGHSLAEDSYGLLPAFIDGLLDEACGQIRLIDGIESAYPNKTLAAFQGSISNYQGGASLSADPSRYLSCVGIGFGTWMDYRSNDLGWYTDPNEFNLNHFTPETFNQAMDISTDLAELSWVYTEIPDWYLGTVPEAYFNALADVTGLPPATPCIELWARLLRAKDPFPADAAQNVHPEVVLSWEAGIKAVSHDVYFGTDVDAVRDANTNERLGVYVGRQDACEYAPAISLELGRTYCWRIDEVNDVNIWQGRVWSFTVDDGKPGNPSPANGATNVPRDTILSWSPGVLATSHDVYIGTNFNDVDSANTSSSKYKGNYEPNEYHPAEPLELGVTYYWRIDEVNETSTWKGDVWSFKAVEFIVADDMESYDDTSNLIYDTWIDGWDNETGSAIELGIDPCDPVHGGQQSMWYSYENGDWFGYGWQYYSEIARTFDKAGDPRDWTIYGVKGLVLYFYGFRRNSTTATEQLYLGLEDGRGAVSYADVNYSDMNDVAEQEWHEWNIDLQDFNDAGVILADVNKVYIGFGIRGNPNPGGTPGGKGTVHFDDIRLYVPRCIPELASAADFTDDCIVQFRDFAILGGQWLQSPGTPSADIAPEPPDSFVDTLDLAVLADNWLKEDLWPAE